MKYKIGDVFRAKKYNIQIMLLSNRSIYDTFEYLDNRGYSWLISTGNLNAHYDLVPRSQVPCSPLTETNEVSQV